MSGFFANLSDVVARWEDHNPDRLTFVGEGPILLLASDYSGQHKGSRFETFSFLVADYVYLWLWDEMRTSARREYLRDGRRMAFKSLGDRQRMRALVPFLRAANSIPGVLITVAVRKAVLQEISFCDDELANRYPKWKRASLSKLTLILEIAAVLVAGLADDRDPSQHVLWLTDHDEIIPNAERGNEALAAMAQVFNALVPRRIGDVSWMTPGKHDDMYLEDLLAIPDLAGGVIAEFLSNHVFTYQVAGDHSLQVEIDEGTGLSPKSETVFDWYSEGHHPLQRLTVVLDQSYDGSYTMWIPDLVVPEKRDSRYDWSEPGMPLIAQSMGWEDAIRRSLQKPYLVILPSIPSQETLLRAVNELRSYPMRWGGA